MNTKQAIKERAAFSRMLRAPAAAAYLGLSPSTLAKMRMTARGPPFSKLGSKVVVYDVGDLDDWIAERKFRSTAEYEEKRNADTS